MSGAESGLTAQLVAFATGIEFANLPQLAVNRAKDSITDAAGCMLAGVHSAESRAALSFALVEGGAPVSRIYGRSERTSPSLAALVNGATGHALDFDDSSPQMIGHPSVVLFASLFALGDKLGSSGKDILTAYVVGLETGARLGRHMNPSHYNAGWHATATLGTMAGRHRRKQTHRARCAAVSFRNRNCIFQRSRNPQELRIRREAASCRLCGS